MVQFDWTVGEIMKTLEENGMAENTIVMFSSDNGPVYDDGYDDGCTTSKSSKEGDSGHDGSGVFRGGKYQIYEGGTRVPFIVSWPAKIKPGKSAALVNQIDFMASFAKLVGVELSDNDGVDSRDMLDAFLGNDSVGLPFMAEEAGKTARAIRRGSWKYIETSQRKKKGKGKKGKEPAKKIELYNLDSDVGEENNIVKAHPEIAADMAAILEKLKADGRTRK